MTAAAAVPPTCADCCGETARPALSPDCAEAFAQSGGNTAALSGAAPTLADRPGVDLIVDACGLEPPEPFVRTMEGLDALPPGGRLLLLLPRQPHPLYRVLEQNGYAWQCTPTVRGVFEILIWQADADGKAG